jgi:GTPase SAR1 family protein
MKLILSKFDATKKIKIIHSLPDNNISDEIQEKLEKIYDEFRDKEILAKFYDFESYLSYLFEVKSSWYSDTTETLVLTLYVEEHENTHIFKNDIKECVSELTGIANFSKALYLNTPHTDAEAFTIFGKIVQSLTKCFFEVNKLHSTYNIGLAEVLVLGNKGGGKTSIVNYLIHNKPIAQPTPTLTPQVYQIVYESMDFRVLDVCCEEHVKQVLEDHPIEPGKLPQAIVYVVDASLKGEKQSESLKEFNQWFNYLSKQYPEKIFETIPILILFNKTDLNPTFSEVEFENIFRLKNGSFTSRYSRVSAITGEGIYESFSWLIKRVRITKKY